MQEADCPAVRLRAEDRRQIDQFGLEGAVKLCSARSINIYMFVIGVIATAFAVAGLGVVAVPAYLLAFIF